MFDIPELPAMPDKIAVAKEKAFRKSMQTMAKLGYNTIQEFMVDMLVEGEYNKSQGTWTEITDPDDIRTDRAHINKAQAKYYGLELIREDNKKPK